MKLAFLVIVTVIVHAVKLFAVYKEHTTIYDTDIVRYRDASNFFDGVFIGMVIVADIYLIL